MKIIILLLLFFLPLSVFAEERLVELQDGTEIPVEHVAAAGERVMLWLPSEFGMSPRQLAVAQGLAESGIEVWMPDLHSGYFIPQGRYSLNALPPEVLLELMQEAQSTSKKQLYVFVSGRMAPKTLEAIRLWQMSGVQKEQLGGAILVSPKLYVGTPQGGEEAVFIPVARATNAPVYLFQPANTAQHWRINSVVSALEEGGAQVYLHQLKGVADGFHLRPLDDTEPQEIELTSRLPAMLNKAIQLLSVTPVNYASVPVLPELSAPVKQAASSTILKPYVGEQPELALKLADMQGNQFALAQLKNKVVVLNFWATWCPPCVEEIPSLERLRELMQADGLEVVSIDVGESTANIQAFLKDKPVDFPVLLDPEAEAFKSWNGYAFPTTFVLDREHKIQYAVFGAFEWDADEVVEMLRQLTESS
ncbi:hypothetical protein BOW28_01025 [Solemya velum gill symbiont]|uniref:TlpA disulfide reductase family protein n=1 Tax=Solemya velum gill symbiont TaxID=2340 RepID=UPI000997925F|nr:TlpA disulfide reductase family protein [Solemya velum gill symbiont]OOZ19030.1 hypothetical protein BOW28_01025 [Solemya velum gill symbiont]OOZ28525.1 hypothetical protein BOW32_01035 [Solemya velum gill symbiont]